MSDERQTAQLVGAWLERTAASPYPVKPGLRQVMVRVGRTRQRNRWWPLPTVRLPSTTTRDRHDTTITARTPTVDSSAKAFITTAVALVIGGAFFIAQPVTPPDVVSPAAEDDVLPAGAVWITGTQHSAPACGAAEIEVIGEVQQRRGSRCAYQAWRSDDARLSGTASSTWNADVYQVEGEGDISLMAATYHVVNDEGAWQCRYQGLTHGSGLKPVPDNIETLTCHGEDGYEGLSAVLILDRGATPRTFEGLVFGGEPPPLP